MRYAEEFFRAAERPSIFGRYEHFTPGRFRVRVDQIFCKDTFKGLRLAVAQCTVTADHQGDSETPVRARRTWARNLAKPSAQEDLEQLVIACMGLDIRDLRHDDPRRPLATAMVAALLGSSEAVRELREKFQIGEGGLIPNVEAVLLGREVEVKCEQVVKHDDKFTICTWRPVGANEDAFVRVLPSNYDGECPRCKQPWVKGDPITKGEDGKYEHAKCPKLFSLYPYSGSWERLSPTQIDTFDLCKRKWAQNYLLGLKGPQTDSAKLGTEVDDEQIQPYLRNGTPFNFEKRKIAGHLTASGEIAEAMRPLLPAPGTVQLQVHVGAPSPSAPADLIYHGYVDLYAKDSQLFPGLREEIKAKGYDVDLRVPAIGDTKTTTDFRWAKTEATLATDTQAMIYAYAGLLWTKAPALDLVWVYGRTKGARAAKRVHLRVDREHVARECTRIDGIGQELVQIKRAAPAEREPLEAYVMSLPYNAAGCEAYGGCPHRARCNLAPNEIATSLMVKDEAERQYQLARQAGLNSGESMSSPDTLAFIAGLVAKKAEAQPAPAAAPTPALALAAQPEPAPYRGKHGETNPPPAWALDPKGLPGQTPAPAPLAATPAQAEPSIVPDVPPELPEWAKAKEPFTGYTGKVLPLNPPAPEGPPPVAEAVPVPPPHAPVEEQPKAKRGRPRKTKDEAPAADDVDSPVPYVPSESTAKTEEGLAWILEETVTITWGIERVNVGNHQHVEIGPFSATITLRPKESRAEALSRGYADLQAFAEGVRAAKVASFKAGVAA